MRLKKRVKTGRRPADGWMRQGRREIYQKLPVNGADREGKAKINEQ
jgi:hypothetical protein